jgi:GTPase Era involved in 16S rRNA processing
LNLFLTFKKLFIFQSNRTIKWKNSIDENARFFDGLPLPCILIENKVDLVSPEEAKNDSEFKEFSQKNKFIGCFRSSAKMGININESMEFLIQNIVDRLSTSSDEMLQKDKKSIVIQNTGGDKYSIKEKRHKDNCC